MSENNNLNNIDEVSLVFNVYTGVDQALSWHVGTISPSAQYVFNGVHGDLWELPMAMINFNQYMSAGYSSDEASFLTAANVAGGLTGASIIGSFSGAAASKMGGVWLARIVGGTLGGFGGSVILGGAAEVLVNAVQDYGGSNAEFFSQYAYPGTVSSANMPGQFGPVLRGQETNALDVMGDTNPFRFSSQGQTETSGLSEASRAAYTDKIRAQTEYVDAVNTDYSFNLASKVSVSDLVRNSNNNSSNSDPHAGHSHTSTVGQDNSQLNRGLDALNTLGSGIDLDAIDNTSTIVFDPKIADPDSGGLGGRGGYLMPIVIDLDGDGIEIISRYNSPVQIDIDGDGYLERTSWVGADDGILVIDLAADGTAGGDGVITQSKEFVFTLWGADDEYASDLAALVGEFDSNGDGVFSALDARWDEFKIWQDLNSGDDGEDKLTLPDGFIVRNNKKHHNNFRMAA